jgi:hypothetical protein
MTLPRWLSIPVEHNALTAWEAQMLLRVEQERPLELSLAELRAIDKLQRWSLLYAWDTQNVVRQ